MKFRIVYMVYGCDAEGCQETIETEHCAGDTLNDIESAEYDYEPYDNTRHDPRRARLNWTQKDGKHYCLDHSPVIARRPTVKWGISQLDEVSQ